MSTSTVKKLTKRDRFEALLKMSEVQANPDMVAFIEHEIELLAKKNAGDKKPTAKQMENDAVKQVILDEMTANPDKLYTVTDLIKGVPDLAEYSNQRVSALLRQMIDANTIVKHGGLITGRGRLPLHHRICFNDGCFDLFGQFNRNRAFFPKFQNHIHAILQEFGGIADHILSDGDLFVAILVHKDEIIALGIKKLEILGVEADLFHGVGAAEADIGFTAVDQVLHFNLHKCAALTWLRVLNLGDFPDATFIFQNIARTNIDATDLHDPPHTRKQRKRAVEPPCFHGGVQSRAR